MPALLSQPCLAALASAYARADRSHPRAPLAVVLVSALIATWHGTGSSATTSWTRALDGAFRSSSLALWMSASRGRHCADSCPDARCAAHPVALLGVFKRG